MSVSVSLALSPPPSRIEKSNQAMTYSSVRICKPGLGATTGCALSMASDVNLCLFASLTSIVSIDDP